MLKGWFPSHIAVKESIDNLPSGICFFNKNGILLLCNRKMYNIFFELANTDLQQLEQMDAIIKDNEFFELKDGTIWRFSKSEIKSDNGESYIQYLASDVTELYQKQQLLRQENIRLTKMYEKQKALFENINDIVRDEETLALKIKVHDDLGRAIISMKHCLDDNSSLDDIKALTGDLRKSFDVLGKTSDYDYAYTIESAVASAKQIGVNVIIKGKPCKEAFNYVLPFVIRECSTNCIRHAGANELYIEMKGNVIKVTDNGVSGKLEITEGGGLQNLRRMCNKNNLEMKIKSNPVFELIIADAG